jgi:RimJ/RimL family protein N-acetyltransferase
VLDGVDVGFMSVENLNGDFGTTCWIGSCWVASEHRRKGALRALFEYVDEVSHERNWKIQGLGVWVDNDGAITAYEKLGYSQKGEPQESTRKPGLYYQRMVKTVTSYLLR